MSVTKVRHPWQVNGSKIDRTKILNSSPLPDSLWIPDPLAIREYVSTESNSVMRSLSGSSERIYVDLNGVQLWPTFQTKKKLCIGENELIKSQSPVNFTPKKHAGMTIGYDRLGINRISVARSQSLWHNCSTGENLE